MQSIRLKCSRLRAKWLDKQIIGGDRKETCIVVSQCAYCWIPFKFLYVGSSFLCTSHGGGANREPSSYSCTNGATI